MRNLAILRIALAGTMLLQTKLIRETFLAELTNPNFVPVGIFRLLTGPLPEAYLPWIYYGWLLACVFVLLGFCARVALPVWAILGLVVFGYESCFGRLSHSTQLAVLASFVLAFSRCADTLSVDAKLFTARVRDQWDYLWPKLTLQLLVVLTFFTLGLQKLYFQGWEWALSDKFYLTIFVNPVRTDLGAWVLAQPLWVSQAMALFALVVVELAAPLAFIRPLNYVFPILWASFHLGVSFVFGGFHLFFLQIPVYLCFYDFGGEK